jgi:chromosome segregation ATPase
MDQATDHQQPWLTLTEAAAASGRHIDALRALVRRRRIVARKGNQGQWLVQLPESAPGSDSGSDSGGLATALGTDSGRTAAAPGSDSGMPWAVAELEADLAEARAAQASAEAMVAELRRALEHERTQHQTERHAHLEAATRAAIAEGRAQSYLESLQDLATRLDRAEARLAMSWWRRMFG